MKLQCSLFTTVMHVFHKILFCSLFVAVFKVDKWIRKERSKYNRLVTSKSSQPNKGVQPAELVTLQRWSFYKDHLLESENMISCDVSIVLNFYLLRFVYVCLSLCLCFCLSVCLFVCVSVSLSAL